MENSPSAARPGPAGHTEASWVPQSRPGRRRGVQGHVPRVMRGGSAFSHGPPTPVPRRTDIAPAPGPFPQDGGGLGPGPRLSQREAGGPAECSPVIPPSPQGGEASLDGCPCSLPACGSEGLPLMACGPAGPESVPLSSLGGTESSGCFLRRMWGPLSTEAATGVFRGHGGRRAQPRF